MICSISPTFESVIAEYKPPFDRAMARRNMHLANLIAMEAAGLLFEHDASLARLGMWREFFAPLGKRYRAQYQCYDFEVADYQLYAISQSWSLLRGPRPKSADIASGRYLTFLGAAQLFGRYQSASPAVAVADGLGLACLNLSTGGSGPESYIDEEIVKLANGGRAVVLQVLSGRSIGCDEYPGARHTRRPNDPGTKIDRLKLLGEIWSESRPEAKRLARKWQGRYVEVMSTLISRIEVPVLLAWVSTRSADDWSIDRLDAAADFGSFPQLVDCEMVREIAPQCANFVDVSHDNGLPYGFTSRFTGEKCPVLRPNGTLSWKNDYYPSAEAGAALSSKIKSALEEVL
jgi:hypothetical protein